MTHLFLMNCACLFSLISSTLLMVLTVRVAERGSRDSKGSRRQRVGAEVARAAESGSREGGQRGGAERGSREGEQR